MIVFIFFAVFATAESKSAPVCSGSAWPPYCHTTAARSVHHFTDIAGPTGWVNLLYNERRYIQSIALVSNLSFNLSFPSIVPSSGILQAQSLLTQLPQSQANLLPTQPSITLATQVRSDASTSFKPALKWSSATLTLLTFDRLTSFRHLIYSQLFIIQFFFVCGFFPFFLTCETIPFVIFLFYAACNSNPHNSNYTYPVPAPQSDTTQTVGYSHSGGA